MVTKDTFGYWFKNDICIIYIDLYIYIYLNCEKEVSGIAYRSVSLLLSEWFPQVPIMSMPR